MTIKNNIKTKAKLIVFNDNKNLSQIYTKGFEFAFCKPVGSNQRLFKQLHQFVLCKDFLHDAVWSSINDKCCRIYGFSFDPAESGNGKISLIKTFMLVRDNTRSIAEFSDHVDKAAKLLNKIENVCKFSHTTVKEVVLQTDKVTKSSVKPTPTGCFILESDNKWMLSPPLLSMYTILIRAGKTYNGEDPIRFIENLPDDTLYEDSSYMKDIKSSGLIPLIFEKNTSLFNSSIKDNYPEDLSCYDIHNYLGVVGYSRMFSTKKTKVKGWAVSK